MAGNSAISTRSDETVTAAACCERWPPVLHRIAREQAHLTPPRTREWSYVSLEAAPGPSSRRAGDRPSTAIFDWIEAWYNPTRRHSRLGNISPDQHERNHHARPKENDSEDTNPSDVNYEQDKREAA